jgi:tartrate-resistant acid phosphatase type 5
LALPQIRWPLLLRKIRHLPTIRSIVFGTSKPWKGIKKLAILDAWKKGSKAAISSWDPALAVCKLMASGVCLPRPELIMTKRWLSWVLVTGLLGCGGSGSVADQTAVSEGGQAGQSGESGQAGESGSSAQGGTTSTGGKSGSSGTGGNSGAGTGGSSQSGTGGTSGTAGSGTAGTGTAGTGTAGAAGTAGSSGTAGSAGSAGGTTAKKIRFIAMGDGGEGNPAQHTVAAAVKTVCEQKGGCDFVLYLGDNIYNSGVSGVDDQQFSDKFEKPYQNLNMPFYVVLGNHDYGGSGTGVEFWKGQSQVDYTQYSAKWVMPDNYYAIPISEQLDLFGLDSNAMMFNFDSQQRTWLQQQTAQSVAKWKIAFGHHTFISNGAHGNAGSYEGLPFVPVVNGAGVEDFIKDAVCNHVDVYICGHDHNRQWLQPTCGTEFIVSGTASKTTALKDKGTPTLFENDQIEGFFYLEISGNQLLGESYDSSGMMEFTRTITK